MSGRVGATVACWRLYRFFDDAGELLYRGKTNEPIRRLLEHLRDQPWADEIATWQRDPRIFYSEAEALAAEKAAIRAERPRYNITHNGGNPNRIDPRTMRRPARVPAQRRGRRGTYRRRRSGWVPPLWLLFALAAWLVLAGWMWHVLGRAAGGPGLPAAMAAVMVGGARWAWPGRRSGRSRRRPSRR